jgi:2,3-dihydroxy-2,3-dihydrophenylpropionate dehydrogenase
MTTIDHKRVFITGGGSGLGLALAKKFLDSGCRVGILELDSRRCSDLSLLINIHVITGGVGWAGYALEEPGCDCI